MKSRRFWGWSAKLAVLACLAGPILSSAAEPPRTRQEYAKAFNQLKEGMPEAEARALLGRPDDLRTQRDAGGTLTSRTREIWRFGTSGHLTTATLGQVCIDENGRVQYVYGKGTPPPVGMFQEKELQRLLNALAKVTSPNAGWAHDPHKLIQAVNLLQPLGKKKALAAIDEWLRVSSWFHDPGREGVFLVLRALFEVPENPGYMPHMLLGAPMPGGPDDPKVFPRFPLVLVDDIPLMLIDSYLLAGEAESPEVHVGYFRKHGKLRALPLVPSITPFKSLDQFAKSPRWIKLTGGDDEFGKGWRSTLSQQLLRLLSSVHQTDNQEAMQFFDDRHQQWLRASVKKASRLKIRWDAKAHRFTFRDGKFFTKPKPVHYHREVWRPKVKEVDLEIILERSSPTEVTLQVYETIEAGKRIPSVAIRVYPADSTDKALAEIHTEAQKAKKLKAGEHGFSGSLSTKTFKLLDGGMVRLRLSVSGKTLSTPVFNP